MRIGNPSMRKILREAESGEIVSDNRASYGGIAGKSLLFGGVTVVAAVVTALLLRSAFANQNEVLLAVLLVGIFASVIPMLVISFVVSFFPRTIKALGIVYSLLQGCLLGVTVFFVDAYYPGIAFAAVLGTLIVFAVAVVLGRMLEVKVRGKFMLGLIVAFVSLLMLEVILSVCSLFVADLQALYTTYLWVQLAVSAFCVFYATIMLMWDLQSAENIVSCGADKKYEWQVAFSLVTTLVYMYVEILELLLRLLMLFGNHRN